MRFKQCAGVPTLLPFGSPPGGELKVHRVWKQGELKETSLIQVSDLTQYI